MKSAPPRQHADYELQVFARRSHDRSRGLAKNANRAFVALALSNIYLSRRRLMARYAGNGRKAGRRPVRNAQVGKKCSGKASLTMNPPVFALNLINTTACSALP
ncbi:hypothetical protein [Caballeronia sp. GAOx1]|uniref:hypothetical protein n=1 Tax=Caballeronia sp. GAOx1 TaxID=2921761 RepID=UPI0020294004|nr:hypothetical protein [Caballeronia sp. GAOx1]